MSTYLKKYGQRILPKGAQAALNDFPIQSREQLIAAGALAVAAGMAGWRPQSISKIAWPWEDAPPVQDRSGAFFQGGVSVPDILPVFFPPQYVPPPSTYQIGDNTAVDTGIYPDFLLKSLGGYYISPTFYGPALAGSSIFNASFVAHPSTQSDFSSLQAVRQSNPAASVYYAPMYRLFSGNDSYITAKERWEFPPYNSVPAIIPPFFRKRVSVFQHGADAPPSQKKWNGEWAIRRDYVDMGERSSPPAKPYERPATQLVYVRPALPQYLTKPHALMPPFPRMKERKAKAGAYYAIMNAYGQYTEARDAIVAVYQALPKDVRVRYKTHHPNLIKNALKNGHITARYTKRGKRYFEDTKQIDKPPNFKPVRDTKTWEMLQQIYRHSDKIDIAQAVKNLAIQNFQDFLIGKAGEVIRKFSVEDAPFGVLPIGYQFKGGLLNAIARYKKEFEKE